MINGLEIYKEKWNIHTESTIKPGLHAISAALAELGNPHRVGTQIHIAGTNGKGSTAAFLHAILREHGFTVANFYSPGIVDLHDQIQVNGKPVSAEELDVAMEELRAIETRLTDFELLTAAAFLIFAKVKPDFSIIEAGMGGKLDSTNVIEPKISIIPSIALEHTEFLGDTLAEVAAHKAGIIKKWVPLVVGPLAEEAAGVIRSTAELQHADLIEVTDAPKRKLALKGPHQQINAQLAFEAAKEVLGRDFDPKKAEAGLAQAQIPFRFEQRAPGLIFDGAHNPASIDALVATIKEVYPDKNIHIVMGILKDKDYITILRKLETVSEKFTFINFQNSRALPAECLFELNKSKIKTIKNICDILPLSDKKEVTIVTGSLYLLSALAREDSPLFSQYIPH